MINDLDGNLDKITVKLYIPLIVYLFKCCKTMLPVFQVKWEGKIFYLDLGNIVNLLKCGIFYSSCGTSFQYVCIVMSSSVIAY